MYKPRGSVPYEAKSFGADELPGANKTLAGRSWHLGARISSWLAVVAFALGSVFAGAQSPACAPNTAVYPCVYVANGNSTVSVINANTNKVVGAVTVKGFAQDVAITPDNSLVYAATIESVCSSRVSCQLIFAVEVIDTAAGKVVANVPLAGPPLPTSTSPAGRFSYMLERT